MSSTRRVDTKEIGHVVNEYNVRSFAIQGCASVYVQNAAFRIATNRGPILVKPFQGPEMRLRLLARRTQRLRNRGFRHMPKWLTSRRGRLWVRRKGRLYYATEWVHGRPLGGEEGNVFRTGAALGQLHRMTAGFVTAAALRSTLEGIRELRQQDQAFRRVLPKLLGQSKEEGTWFRDHADECKRLADGVWSALHKRGLSMISDRQRVRPALIHGDVTRPNVMVSKSGIRFIDWDNMRVGSAVLELMKTLANLSDFQPSLMNAFLRGYETERPLTKDERFLIIHLFRLPREAWYAARQLTSGKKSTLFTIVQRSWPSRLEALRWLENWEARRRHSGFALQTNFSTPTE